MGAMMLKWTQDPVASQGVVERGFALECDARPVPGILWTAEEPTAPAPLVLIGHGGSGHKGQPHLRALARRLVRHHRMACVAIDGPVHGERRPVDLAPDAVAETRRRFARPESVDAMLADWRATVAAVQDLPEVGVAPLGYWGLSMGTLFGVPLLAAEPRIVVGVIGLMGIRPDGGRIAARLAEDAPRVRCPVLFLQQRQDELFPVESSGKLFDALASADKRLHAHPGAHAAVPPEEFRASEEFLARHLSPRGGV
jgi:dienelactone hydrolase